MWAFCKNDGVKQKKQVLSVKQTESYAQVYVIALIGFLATTDNNVPQAQITRYEGQHLMKISIGTPPVDIYGLADTTTGFVWTQCLPCNVCLNQINPKFDPQKSSTYSEISCHSEQCHQTEITTYSPQNICNYDCGYAIGFTKGLFGWRSGKLGG